LCSFELISCAVPAGTFQNLKARANRAIVPDSPVLERRRAELRAKERVEVAQAQRLRLAAIRGEFAEVQIAGSLPYIPLICCHHKGPLQFPDDTFCILRQVASRLRVAEAEAEAAAATAAAAPSPWAPAGECSVSHVSLSAAAGRGERNPMRIAA
jgi:hypothetical protein